MSASDSWVVIVEWRPLARDEQDVGFLALDGSATIVAVHGPYTWEEAQGEYQRLGQALTIVNDRTGDHALTCYPRLATPGKINVTRYIEAVNHEPAQ
jgi:hypothetical protein